VWYIVAMWDFEHLKYAGIRTIVNTSLYVRRSSWLSPTTQPNQVKTYPCRPNLYACRIFTPPEHDGQSKLPLVIRAHGGGFVGIKAV
jgi:acetyl esterase/lipase